MHTTNLRKVGGSVMLAVPPAILDMLQLKAGEAVGLEVDGGWLVVKPRPGSRYRLEALLAQCETSAESSPEDRAWLSAAPVGDEVL